MKQRQTKVSIRHWGRIIFRYRWPVVGSWVFLICLLAFFAVRTPSLLKESGFNPEGSPSQLGIQFLESRLGMSAASMDIVLESTTEENLTTAAAQRRIWDELAPLRRQPYVKDMYTSMATRLTGQDGITAITVLLNEASAEALQHFESIKESVPQVTGTHTYVAGNTAVYYDLNHAVKRDIVRAESFGLPCALLILLLIFRTVPAAMLPLVIGITSVTITMGILYFVADLSGSLSNFLPNMVTMLGLAVGIDYALFMVSRFREELRTRTVEEALIVTFKTAGKSVVISGTAVCIGLLALQWIQLPIFHSLSIGGLLVVLVSVLASISLLPALLGILGHRINDWQVRLYRKKGRIDAESSPFWSRVSRFVVNHPALIVTLVTASLLTAMVPAFHMKLGIPSSEVLPPSYESRYGSELMKKAYEMKEVNAIEIAVEMRQPYDDPQSILQIKSYMSALRELPHVSRVESYASVIDSSAPLEDAITDELRSELGSRHVVAGNAAVIAVVPENGDTDPDTVQLVKEIRRMQPSGLNVYVTGSPAYKLDIMERIENGIPYAFAMILLLTYILLFIAFRSVLLPLKAVIMNLLSLGASFGIVVLVFQEGMGSAWLQVSYIGSVFAIVPVLIFCVVFGISMDYEVIMLSRIMEAFKEDGNNERSTAIGLQRTGGMITGAALILIFVAGAFIFTDNEVMKALGLGLTLSVLIDVTIVRVLLVPALMKLLGRANWWSPRWLSMTNQSVEQERTKRDSVN